MSDASDHAALAELVEVLAVAQAAVGAMAEQEQAAAADIKRLATLTARAALAGVKLYAVDGDDGRPEYIVTRWALTRAFRNLAEVESWLGLIGAPG